MHSANDEKRMNMRTLLRGMVTLILAICMAVSGVITPLTASAATYGDLQSGLGSGTYALQVSTGAVSTTGTLADEILYFKITYKDENNNTRSHRIFPSENALKNSVDWAKEQGTDSYAGVLGTLGITVAESSTAFSAYSTDTFFFQPLKKIKSVESIEILMCDNVGAEKNVTNGTWTCQSMRVYEVTAVHGVYGYGAGTARTFADFEGTLISQMSESKTFNWNTDHVFRITKESGGDARLADKSEAYSTKSTERVLRMDIADTYGAGIRALGNAEGMGLADSAFGECAALVVRYVDIYGATREVSLPLATGIAAYALNKGVSGSEPLSGIAQDGDTVALSACFPDMQSVSSVRLVYGTEAATAACGITSQTSAARTVSVPDEANSDTDILSVLGFSVYDPTTAEISVKIENTKLNVTFSGTPLYYYRASSASGTNVRPVKAGSTGTEIALTAYESGARLLPSDSGERYVIGLSTDTTDLGGTTGELMMTLTYTDTSGQTQTSESINVSDAVTAYYGEWPGVSEGFMYRVGTSNGGKMYFSLTLKDVYQFTGVRFSLRGEDDWQMSGIEIYRVDSLGHLYGTWESITDGKETSDRSYSRDLTGSQLLSLEQKVLVEGGQEQTGADFTSDSTSTPAKDTGDWSQYRYSMSYETTQTLARFAKSRYYYTVAVEVGDDQVTDTNDGDCGSKNQFYFQLVFEDGKSAYVLANQQLASDGFRTGYTERFTISTNRDMGELTAVKIFPEDVSEKSDVFDKLKIDSICVQKQTTEAVSRQWVINNVGWVDINYQDEAADSSSAGYTGRTESELANTYQVEVSTYAVNLEFAITTGAYNDTQNGTAKDTQFTGQVYGVVEYYDTNGTKKTVTYNLVEAMYDYNGKEKKVGKSEIIGQYTWPGGTESDPSTMFRAGKTDRFTLAIDDISQLLRVTLEIRSKQPTTLNIENVVVSYVGSGGRRIINTQNEYQWQYDTEATPLCYSTKSGVKAYSVYLPANQVQAVDIEFTQNDINWSNASKGEISSVTSRLPQSADDSLNVYVYLDENELDESAVRKATMEAGLQYSRVYGGFTRTETKLTLGESDGRNVFYATGVSATGFNTLNSMELLAYFDDLNSTDAVPLDYAIVQQVRSGVIINTFYLSFTNCDAAINSSGVSSVPESLPEHMQSKQVLTLAFGSGTTAMRLTPESDDIAVSLLYTTTNDDGTQQYESSMIYLTDQNISEIRAGRTVDVEFNEPFVKEIVGIRVRGTGHGTRSGVSVASAAATCYNTDAVTGEYYSVGSFGFANGVTLSAGQGDQIMYSTGNVGILTLSFTVPLIKDVPAVAENANGEVGLTVNYRTDDNVIREVTVSDILDVADSGTSFSSGSTVTMRLLLPRVQEVRYVSLAPENTGGDDATLALSEMSATLDTNGTSVGYERNLSDWEGSGVIPLFNTVKVRLTAETANGDRFTVDSGTKQVLVSRGDETEITVKLIGTDEDYAYTAVKFKDSFTTDASDMVDRNGDELTFSTEDASSGDYYRLTVRSREIPAVQTIIEFVVE